ncbi:MAG: hypothetical protein QG637_1155, partial [Chloroflexota bacterium]|nr:hypothetical protein [Chloroflexota bacterium]
ETMYARRSVVFMGTLAGTGYD